MTSRAAVACLSALAAIGLGCTSGERSAELPQPDLAGMEPQVVRLLNDARLRAEREPLAETIGDLGALYDAHGLLAEAEACYREASALEADSFEWRYLLAIVREIRGADLDEVRELFDRAAQRNDQYAPLYVRLGAALSLRGEHASAVEALRRAIALDASQSVAHRALGQALLALDRPQEALAPLERAIELAPQDLAAQVSLAQTLARLGQSQRAEATIEASRELQPMHALDDPIYGRRVFMRSVSSSRAFSRAQAAIRAGRMQEALDDLEQVLIARPDDASVHYWTGLAHARTGQPELAVERLSRAVSLEPTLRVARLTLAAQLLALQRHAAAAVQIEAAAALEPLDAEGQFYLASAYEGSGRRQDALVALRRALELRPDYAAAAEALARLAQ